MLQRLQHIQDNKDNATSSRNCNKKEKCTKRKMDNKEKSLSPFLGISIHKISRLDEMSTITHGSKLTSVL